MVRVLEHLGCEVVFPGEQTCCGQPMFNAGYPDASRPLAERMIEIFEPYGTIVTPSASCASMVREQFPRLFSGDTRMLERSEKIAARTFEFVEFLVKVLRFDAGALGVCSDGRATFHPSCHGRSIGAGDESLKVMRNIRGLRVEPLRNAEQCCGFGGLFSVKQPTISGAMVREKVACVRESGAGTLVCNDAGCRMNIEGFAARTGAAAGGSFRTVSLAELIAEGLGLIEPEDERDVERSS